MRCIFWTLPGFVALCLSGCEVPQEPPIQPPPQPKVEPEAIPAPALLSKRDLDAILLERHAKDPQSVWDPQDEQSFWSAVALGEGLVNAKVDPQTHDSLGALIAQGRVTVTANYPQLGRKDLQVADYAAFRALRDLPGLSELEPAAYPEPGKHQHYSSGLGCSPQPDTIHPADTQWITPGARVPWNFYAHKIPQAWQQSSGHSVTIGIVDTGSSDHQAAFSPHRWSAGWSGGRFIERRGTYIDSVWRWAKRTDGPHDRCGHGTYMSSIAAAPRTAQGDPVGVAYGANLVVYRASKDVFLDDYHEKKGVAQSILELADRNDVKVISMSMGYIFHARNIADAIRYAYARDKLIVAAAGTSFKATNSVGVVFPARMQETVALTGLLDTEWIEACVECHYGSQVDYAMVVQRQDDTHRRSVTLGHRSGDQAYAGGSSAATAMFAGVAALVWSKHPHWSRAQVLAKLQQSADLYPERDAHYGYGRIDAARALAD